MTRLFIRLTMFAGTLAWLALPAGAAEKALRFDCGPADSPTMAGYEKLSPDQTYTKNRGFGWEGETPTAVSYPDLPMYAKHSFYPYMMENLNDLNRDSVLSEKELAFRADVPDGTYRVTVTIGDMGKALGSIDVTINGELAAAHAAAWTHGSFGGGNHRRLMLDPYGWWSQVRRTVEVKDGSVTIKLTKNQTFYDESVKKQDVEEKAWAQAVYERDGIDPYKRIGMEKAPYYYCGWPFVENAIMAIEILPNRPAPVEGEGDQLRVAASVKSPGVRDAVEAFNAGRFADAAKTLERATEPDAAAARGIVALWLAGRPELEEEKTLVPGAVKALRAHVAEHPGENRAAEILQDAEVFEKGLKTHLERGDVGLRNHFMENVKAVSQWWAIQESSPLYYKTQLYIARALHMLIPYMPVRGTEREIFRKLEKKFPDNRYVKYFLYQKWEQQGDGSRFDDWVKPDHTALVKDSPAWVKSLYPAWANMVDWSEWFVRYKQKPQGNIGGGWGDDVEVVGTFGYLAHTSRGISESSLQGTRNMVEGMWKASEVDPELGFCLPMADAEHAAEWTGNTLGMMVQIDYGNPIWVERAMKTAKLMRDLWTDTDKNGHRHFRANFFGAAQVGGRELQMNDSWINYRAIRPASAVIAYNQNPVAAKLYIELADAWLAAAMSTERDKIKGVIPAEVSFPEGIVGGKESPTWYEAKNGEGSLNESLTSASGPYKAYLYDVFLTAFKLTRDPKYLEPMKLEYELAAKYNFAPAASTGARMEIPDELAREAQVAPEGKRQTAAPVGSEEWVAAQLVGVKIWDIARTMSQGREGALQNDITKDEIVRYCDFINKTLQWRWPLMTTESSATDRVDFVGSCNAFFIYTGGKWGGAYMEAPITYDNTTRQFAAAVLGSDPMGFRLLYHSLAPETRTVGIVPWDIEVGGRYKMKYGPDKDEDEKMDSVAGEKEFEFPQPGTPVEIQVEPRVTYVVEVDQVKRGRARELLPDPAIAPEDIRLEEDRHLLLARVHNAGSAPIRGLEVAAYDGDPKAGGTLIGRSVIPNLAAPLDLEPATTTVGFTWTPTKKEHEVFIVLDPDGKLKAEITNFNNTTRATLRPALDGKRVFRGEA